MTSEAYAAIVIERTPAARQRIARTLQIAARGERVGVFGDPEEARRGLESQPNLVACDARDAARIAPLLRETLPFSQLVVWGDPADPTLLNLARGERRFSSLVSWPAHRSAPRPWELLFVASALLRPHQSSADLESLLDCGAQVVRWSVRSTEELARATDSVMAEAARFGLGDSLSERIGGVAHELLMNAVYDAPVDAHGRALYAEDRKAAIQLDEEMAPSVEFGIDGTRACLQVRDPFGRLTREHVFEGIVRGVRASGRSNRAVLSTDNGGAGLGIYRTFRASAVTLFRVRSSVSTQATSVFDLDLSPRELRGMSSSVHFLES